MSDAKLVESIVSALSKKRAEDGKGRFEELVYAEKLAKSLPPIKVVADDWYAYQDGAWMPVTRDEFRPKALATCPRNYRSARNAQNLLEHLETRYQARQADLVGIYRQEVQDDGEVNTLINCANGVVKVWHTGEVTLEKHSPDYGFTERAAARWDAKAECPLFIGLQEAALPDAEDRQLLKFYAGNILHPTAQFETALICYGLEGTGKSTLAESIMYALVGSDDKSDLVTSLSMTQICDSRSYSLPKLRLAALNLGTEVDTVDLDESANFKQIVSGERVEARPIYGRPIAMRTPVKLLFLSNSIPRFKNGTGAELRRLRFLHFTVVPPVKDASLKDRIRAERDGIFRWMVEGLIELQALGSIPQGGPKSAAVAAKFAISNDPVGYFVKTRCQLSPAATVRKATMQGAFKAFLMDHGLPEQMEDWFFRRLYERFASQVRQRRERGISDDERWLDGIDLAPGVAAS